MNPKDLVFSNAEWRLKYRQIISRNKPTLSSYNPNSYNYRYETLGREDDSDAYRSAVFYIQLSPSINPKIIEIALQTTQNHIYNHASNSRGAFHLMFMNDEEGKLIHVKKPCYQWGEAAKVVDDHLDKYAASNYLYSKKLAQLFPMIDMYSRLRYPDKSDLCVLVTDSEGVQFNETVKDSILKRCNKLVKIVADNENDVQVELVEKI